MTARPRGRHVRRRSLRSVYRDAVVRAFHPRTVAVASRTAVTS